jgi:hypothetical protein
MIFFRGACTFRSIFPVLTPPPILEISAQFAISGLSMKNVYPFKGKINFVGTQVAASRISFIETACK